jgi:hypothetical protein
VYRNKCLIPHRHGYVLLLTLVLLALAALAMTAVSRAAIARVQAAAEAQSDLQRRWGALSCSAALLPKTEEILHSEELRSKAATASWRCQLRLGDEDFNLIFADESAKASIAALIQRQGREQAELTVRRLSLASNAAGTVHFRSRDGQTPPQCFGDVFENASPLELCNCPMDPSPADLLTCWGDGSLNIHRASETVLREGCTGILNLTQIHALIQLQKSNPNIDLDSALNQLQLSAAKRVMARWALTDNSSCHSLWIDCRTARRGYWSLDIADQSTYSMPRLWHFEW